MRGIFHGQGVTILREIHGYGVGRLSESSLTRQIYFLSYETLVQRYARRHGGDRKALPATAAAGYGALSGIVLWLNIYPLDAVKRCAMTLMTH